MNSPLKPRQVESPFILRWSRMTLELIIRSPIRFGLVIAILGTCDTYFVRIVGQYLISQAWVDRVGTLLLPILWTFIGVLARSADVPQSTREALEGVTRRNVWWGVLVTAAYLLSFNLLINWVTGEFIRTARPQSYLREPGQFVDSIAANVMIITISFGWCYFPLLALHPNTPWLLVRRLSREAAVLNNMFFVWAFMCAVCVLGDALSAVIPAFGMTMAAILVFLGTLNYVAYRDIFERRARNASVPAAVIAPAGPVAARR